MATRLQAETDRQYEFATQATEGQGANVEGKNSSENVEGKKVESPILAEMFLNCSEEGYKDHPKHLNSGQELPKHVFESNVSRNQSSVEGSSYLPPNIIDVEQSEVVDLPKTQAPVHPTKLMIWRPLGLKGEPLACDDIKQQTAEKMSKQNLNVYSKKTIAEDSSTKASVKDVEHSGTIGRLQAPVLISTEAQIKGSNVYPMLLVDESFPFIKCSPAWEIVESREVFRVIPQWLHFRPLEQFDMVVREGLAIGSMVSFANIVEKVRKSKLDDPLSILQDRSNALEDLKAYGFNVQPIQARLEKILRIKDEHAKLNDDLMKAEDQFNMKLAEKISREKELDELNRKMRELQECLNQLSKKKRELMTVLEKEVQDSSMAELKKTMDNA